METRSEENIACDIILSSNASTVYLIVSDHTLLQISCHSSSPLLRNRARFRNYFQVCVCSDS